MYSGFYNIFMGSKRYKILLHLARMKCDMGLLQEAHLNPNIQGIRIGYIDNKICFYADDILLLAQNPLCSIPVLLIIVEEFGGISGFKVNWTKSEVMPLNNHCSVRYLQQFPFDIKTTSMKYLGINLTLFYENMFSKNGPQILRGSSLWGRADTLKINMLPRLLYVVNSIP
uniref:Reverse transcriptase domain-containing protein n=1 Tax=Latimeria chalumnae TaxID=7897 RepID=H3AWW0_LATCH